VISNSDAGRILGAYIASILKSVRRTCFMPCKVRRAPNEATQLPGRSRSTQISWTKAPGPVQPNSRSDVRPVRDPWNMRREQAPPASWPAVGGITASLESLWIKARAYGRLAAPRIWRIVRGFRANRRLRHVLPAGQQRLLLRSLMRDAVPPWPSSAAATKLIVEFSKERADNGVQKLPLAHPTESPRSASALQGL
jgi:hypothetical protein